MASTITTFAALLKTRYTQDKVENLTMAERPLLARLQKSSEFSGDGMVVPLIDVNPQGVAAQNLSTAQSNATSLSSKKFTITLGDYFGSVVIGGKVMALSRNNLGAFLENKLAETDGLYEQIADNLHIHCWGNGGGAIGKRASAATNVITLSDKSSVFAFEVGMTVVASGDGDGSAGTENLRAGSTTVASVQPDAGTVTLTNAASITSFADGDFLFRAGDFFGSVGAGIIKGVQAYITATNSPGVLFGMTRTSNPTRLAGCRVLSTDLTGLNIEQRIKTLGAFMGGRYKAKIGTDGYLNPEDWQTLEIALNSRGIRSLDDDRTSFGFRVLEVVMGGQNVRIYADRACPKGSFFVLRNENWKLWSAMDLIHPVQADGLTLLRQGTSNDYEYRLESWPQLACNAPLYNGRVPV